MQHCFYVRNFLLLPSAFTFFRQAVSSAFTYCRQTLSYLVNLHVLSAAFFFSLHFHSPLKAYYSGDNYPFCRMYSSSVGRLLPLSTTCFFCRNAFLSVNSLILLLAAFFFFGQQRTAYVSIAPSVGSLNLFRQHSAFGSLFLSAAFYLMLAAFFFCRQTSSFVYVTFLFCWQPTSPVYLLLFMQAGYFFCRYAFLSVGSLLLLPYTFTFSRLGSLLFLLTAFFFCIKPSTYVGIHLLLAAFFSFVGTFFFSRRPSSSVNSLFFLSAANS